MNKRILTILILILGLFLPKISYAYWIWTPKTGKFVNPKYTVRKNPKDQFLVAMDYYQAKDYDKAIEEFQKLIKYFPGCFEAAESQYYIGMSYENRGNSYDAYLAYQKVIDKYPFSGRVNEVIEREYAIAERFMEGETRKIGKIPLPVENPSIEILRKVVENAPYGKLAAKAQYKLGLVLKNLGYYLDAQDEFEKVIANYPNSEWVEPAKFQIAASLERVSPKVGYDQEYSKEAREKFEEFVSKHPDAELTQKAQEHIGSLKNKEARNNFDIAQFYFKNKAYGAAKIYYQIVIDYYPDTDFAEKSRGQLKAIEILEHSQKMKEKKK
ncbi:MAG: outer membrane protein assembly factor BamD [Candidatus Omnitrophota bacterium]